MMSQPTLSAWKMLRSSRGLAHSSSALGLAREIFLASAISGTGSTPAGDRPFLDRLDLKTLKADRLFHCAADRYEAPAALLADDGSRFLTRSESAAEPPNYFLNAREGEAMKIFIGSESELFALSGSSVIAAPYRGHDGKLVGVVGVIGPTRLNYARVVPMVDFTAKTLSRLMG